MEIIMLWILLGLVFGALLALLVTPLIAYCSRVFYFTTVEDKYANECIEHGKTVTAHYFKSRDEYRTDHRTDNYRWTGRRRVIYKYTVNGKTYKYRILTWNNYPDEFTLYYMTNPRRVSTDPARAAYHFQWVKWYLRVTAVLTAVIAAAGSVIYGGDSKRISAGIQNIMDKIAAGIADPPLSLSDLSDHALPVIIVIAVCLAIWRGTLENVKRNSK